MPISHPRINIVCEEPKARGTFVSAVDQELTEEALELRGDQALGAIADKRTHDFNRGDALTFNQIFGE